MKAANGLAKNKTQRIGAGMMYDIGGWALALPTIILFIFLTWRPIVIAFGYSLFDLKGMTPVSFVGLQNFRDILSDTNFLQTLKNTVGYVFCSLILGFPIPFFLAVMVNEMTKGKEFFKFALYLPVVMPGVVTSLVWAMIYSDGSGGLLNMLLAQFGAQPKMWLSDKNLSIFLIIVSMTWQGFGGTMIMYLATLQGVDNSLYEAARIDGAGFWKRFQVVTLPHLLPMALLMGVKQIIAVFNVTEQPMIMTGGGPNGASMTLGLTNYYYAFRYGHFDKSMALGVIMFIMLVGLTFVYFGVEKKLND